MTTRTPTPLLCAAAIWLLAPAPVLRAADAEVISLPPVTVTATKPAASEGNLEICPAWTIIVLDEKGQPVSGLTVSQTWRYYGIDKNAGPNERDRKVTDAQGKVAFPARSLSVNPLKFAAARAAHAVSLNVHESFGPVADNVVSPPPGYKSAPLTWADGKVSVENSRVKTVKNKDGFTTTLTLQRLDLVDAVRNGNAKAVEQFLSNTPNSAIASTKADVTASLDVVLGYGQFTPEAVALASSLIAAGADVNFCDKAGQTPLYQAARRSNVEMMTLLLSKGAEVKPTIYNPAKLDTPLHTLVSSSYQSKTDRMIQAIDLLLANGVDVNAKDPDGNTPLHFAAQNSSRPEIVRALLERGADPAARNAKGQTPLDFTKHYTATARTPETQELITHPPPVKIDKPAAEPKSASAPPPAAAPAK